LSEVPRAQQWPVPGEKGAIFIRLGTDRARGALLPESENRGLFLKVLKDKIAVSTHKKRQN
jgi:hypothetical protein